MSAAVRHVLLVGLPGSGKSAVARPLAAQLGWKAVELDAEIERLAGKSVAAIFEDAGEGEFRRLEAVATAGLSELPGPAVVSTGGGWIGNVRARELVPGTWPILYLRVSPAEAASRLGELARRRPLLADEATPEAVRRRLEELARDRVPLYEEADAVVDTGGLALDEVVSRAAAAVAGLVGEGGRG